MKRKHVASIDEFLKSAEADAAVAGMDDDESIFVPTRKKAHHHVTTDFGNEGKRLKMRRPLEEKPAYYVEPCAATERMIQVHRYGRIYRRRTQTATLKNFKADGPAGTRWCRMCNEFMPLDAFYEKVKRYVCRKHHRIRVILASERSGGRALPGKYDLKKATVIAMDLLDESCDALGMLPGQIDDTDVRTLIASSKLPLELRPVVCPIDPTINIFPYNVAILSRTMFLNAVNLYQMTNSRALFVGIVQRCNLLPFDFDVSMAHDPHHDPTYKRKDMDVAAMLNDELKNGVAPTLDETVIAEIEATGAAFI